MQYELSSPNGAPVQPEKEVKAGPLTIPEFMPGIPVLPPSSRHIFASRGDFEARFPVRAAILHRLETATAPGDLTVGELGLMRSVLSKLNNLDRYIDEHSEGKRSLLREGQFQAFQSYSRFLETGGSDGYIKLPPRTGKTVLFIAMIDALGLHKLREKCLIVVPSQFLADQAKSRFEQFAPHLTVGVHYSGSKSIKTTKAPKSRKSGEEQDASRDQRDKRFNWSALPEVTIIVKDSLRNLEASGTIRKGDFSAIFLDEGHEMLGPKTSRAIDRLRDDKTYITAFTATPKYSELKNLRIFLGPEIHAMSIQDAVAMGMLTDYSVITAESEVDLSDIEVDLSSGEYSARKLESAMHEAGLNKSVVRLLKSDLMKDRSAIVFTATNDQAEEIAKLARRVGISCEAIGEKSKNNGGRKLTKEERQRKINGHQDGTIRVLAGPKLLGTGYDNPRVSAVIILVPFTSPVPVEQFSTRPLTPDPSNPEKIGIIVQYLHRDRRMQHRQQTFLDCIYGTNVDRYENDQRKRGTRGLSQKSVAIPGLKLSIDPTQVLKVLENRPEPIPSHEIDDAQSAYRELGRKRDGILWATPKALNEIGKYSKTLRDEDGRRFAADIHTLRGRVKAELPQTLSITSTEKMLLFRRHTYGEAVRHFQRRHDVKFDTEPFLSAARLSLRAFRDRADRILAPLAEAAETHGTTPYGMLAHFDSRVSRTGLEDSWVHGFPAARRAELGQHVAPVLESMRKLEERMKVRWDVAFAMTRELADIDSKLAAIRTHDHTPSVVRFAEERAADFIAQRRKERGISIDESDDAVLGTMTADEVKNLAVHTAIEVAMRPKMLGTVKKFSRTATEEIRAVLAKEIEESELQQVSFTPKENRNGVFKNWSEVVVFERFLELHYVSTGRKCDIEDVAAKYGEDLDRAAKRLAEYSSIRPVESLAVVPRAVLREIPDREEAEEGSVGESALDHEALKRRLDEVLLTLSEREREVLRSQYGLDDGQEKTLDEIAPVLKVARGRVRQIGMSAERKLQAEVRARKLRDFLPQ